MADDVKMRHEDSTKTINVQRDVAEVYESQGWYEPPAAENKPDKGK